MSDDPEQVLAEALRAQAGFAPSTQSPPTSPPPAPRTEEPPGGYGLLSGAGAGSLEREHAALEASAHATPAAPGPVLTAASPASPPPSDASLPVPWMLVLAVTLGLAAGSVVGLLTLL